MVVRNDGAIIGFPIHACLDVVDLGDGDVVELDAVTANVAKGGFLLEEVAAAWDAMGERKGGDGEGAVFVDGLRSMGVDFVEDDFVG